MSEGVFHGPWEVRAPFADTKHEPTSKKDSDMSILRTIRSWWAARNTEKELARLGDRELNDAGIARWNIGAVARGAPTSTAQVV